MHERCLNRCQNANKSVRRLYCPKQHIYIARFINFKMPIIVGVLKVMTRTIFMLMGVDHETFLLDYTLLNVYVDLLVFTRIAGTS